MKISVHQMCSSIDPEKNYTNMIDAIHKSSLEGASMYFAPEMSMLIDRDRARSIDHIKSRTFKNLLESFSLAAADHSMWLHLGSVPVFDDVTGKLANRSIVFAPNGERRGHYDKIHLFDVSLLSGESWLESSAYTNGHSPVAVETPLGLMGLTICYDLRFPQLFANLIKIGVNLIAVPAAFTVSTGRAHWHALLKARAIEAQAFVIAAAQSGHHEDGRATFGHSLVVDPWGEIILDMAQDEGLGFVDINITRIDEIRKQIPVHANRKDLSEYVQVF
jgi:predicted amidohydrolase